jgi:hypothetical protein
MLDINHYDATAWFLFRSDAIKIAGGCCERCSRSAGDGLVLQVHHKEYIRGHKPWEYEHSDCEVLCKGCHAKEHGKIQPTSDWVLVGEDDLEEVCGICDNCGTEIRYVFFIEHPKWNSMAVGTDCCDYLTESEEATKWRRFIEKKKRFINSKSWNFVPKHGNCITKSGVLIQVKCIDNKFRIVADGIQGKKLFISEIEAKTTVFDLLHNNTIQNFLKDRRANQRRD